MTEKRLVNNDPAQFGTNTNFNSCFGDAKGTTTYDGVWVGEMDAFATN